MQCIVCGEKLDCVESRQCDEHRYRIYDCVCGERFATIEVFADYDFAMRHINKVVYECKKNNRKMLKASKSNLTITSNGGNE